MDKQHPTTLSSLINPQLVHVMRNNWNLPPHFKPIYPENALLDMSFFPPETLTQFNPIFIPWENPPPVQEPHIPQPPHPPLSPPHQPAQNQEPAEAEMEEKEEPLNIIL